MKLGERKRAVSFLTRHNIRVEVSLRIMIVCCSTLMRAIAQRLLRGGYGEDETGSAQVDVIFFLICEA